MSTYWEEGGEAGHALIIASTCGRPYAVAMSLEQTRADWDQLGRADPLWAVLVDPKTKNGNWDQEAFFATGKAEVARALDQLEKYGFALRGHALDFGCGVGRLTRALAAEFEKVTGVDISAEMLTRAREFDHPGQCEYLHNTRSDLSMIPSESVDLVFSSIVLQHIPPAAAWAYLREFTRIVRKGGAVVILVPTRIRLTPKGVLALLVPHRVQGWLQKTLLGYPAPMRMHSFAPKALRRLFASAGLTTAGAINEPGYSPHWTVTRFYAIKH